MAKPTGRDLARAVLDECGRTFSQEISIRPEKNTPAELFKLLVFSILGSARISHQAAARATKALFAAGWTTARKMNDSTWRQRTDTLNRNGYARYDESTSRYLGDTSAMLLEKYGGDLRKLREAADRDPAGERELLKECKGIGDVGVDIFFREVQTAWEELFPFIDRTAAEGARQLGLPTDAGKLAKLVGRDDFPALVAALARVKLEKRYESVKQKAA